MPKLTITKKWQQKRAEVACSARASYSLVDLDSSEEYLDSSSNSDESSDDNFIDLDNLDDANIIIEQLRVISTVGSKKKRCPSVYIENSKHTRQRRNKTFREAAIRSLKITHFFSSIQPLMVDNDESYRDFQDQGDQSDDELEEELDDKVLSTTEKAHYLAVLYFLRLHLQGQKKIEASKTVADIVNSGPWLAR
ncbi:4113_t:CDS:2, partial [Scutellospora calospora]